MGGDEAVDGGGSSSGDGCSVNNDISGDVNGSGVSSGWEMLVTAGFSRGQGGGANGRKGCVVGGGVVGVLRGLLWEDNNGAKLREDWGRVPRVMGSWMVV